MTLFDATHGPVQIKVTGGTTTSEPYNVTARTSGNPADGSLAGPLRTRTTQRDHCDLHGRLWLSTQSGALSTPPSITIGGAPAAVLFNNALTATYGGLVTPSGDLITVRR